MSLLLALEAFPGPTLFPGHRLVGTVLRDVSLLVALEALAGLPLPSSRVHRMVWTVSSDVTFLVALVAGAGLSLSGGDILGLIGAFPRKVSFLPTFKAGSIPGLRRGRSGGILAGWTVAPALVAAAGGRTAAHTSADTHGLLWDVDPAGFYPRLPIKIYIRLATHKQITTN